jgi:hypothetical protein
MKHFAIVASLVCVLTAPVLAEDLGRFVDGELSGLVSTYKGIHAHPELSHHEEMTAALLATELRKAGFTVTEHVGKYPDGTQAYGVVAILENGPGHHAEELAIAGDRRLKVARCGIFRCTERPCSQGLSSEAV